MFSIMNLSVKGDEVNSPSDKDNVKPTIDYDKGGRGRILVDPVVPF
jgi:hypothetical protein